MNLCKNTPRGLPFILVILFISILFPSCDMGSYNPIARALDPFEPMGPDSAGWMNVEGSVGSSSAQVLLLQQGMPSHGDAGAYAFIDIKDNSFPSPLTEIVLIRGTYEVSGNASGTLTLMPYTEYRSSYRQTSNPANNPAPADRQGEVNVLDFSRSGNNLRLGSAPVDFTALSGSCGVLDSIYLKTTPGNPTGDDQVRAAQILLAYQIGVYMSQVIIPGFGGTGMMTYYNNETPFNGIVNGREFILMSSMLPVARVDFTYEGTENLPGLSMAGILRSDANAKGDGDMSETVTTQVYDGVREYEISVSYNDIVITGTIPSSGDYMVTVEGFAETVPCTAMKPGMLDFPGILAP